MEVALPFPVSVGLLPKSPSSEMTAPKKGTPRSNFPGGWDREFAGCGESKPPSGKKRQPPSLCLQASIWKEQVHLYNARPPDLLRGPKFQRQGRVSPLPFAILAKTFLADSGIAHEEASSGNMFDMTECLPGLAPCPLVEGVGPSSLHTAKGWSKASSVRGTKRAIGWIFKLLLENHVL